MPVLFTKYMDDLFLNCSSRVPDSFLDCLFYADVILLISHSLHRTQHMLDAHSSKSMEPDLKFHVKRSMDTWIGNRYKNMCAPLELDNDYLPFRD